MNWAPTRHDANCDRYLCVHFQGVYSLPGGANVVQLKGGKCPNGGKYKVRWEDRRGAMSAETVIRGANLLEGEKAVRRKAELRVQRGRSVEDT